MGRSNVKMASVRLSVFHLSPTRRLGRLRRNLGNLPHRGLRRFTTRKIIRATCPIGPYGPTLFWVQSIRSCKMMEQLKNRLWQNILGPVYSWQIFGGEPIRPRTEEWRIGPNRAESAENGFLPLLAKDCTDGAQIFRGGCGGARVCSQVGHNPTRPDLGRIG